MANLFVHVIRVGKGLALVSQLLPFRRMSFPVADSDEYGLLTGLDWSLDPLSDQVGKKSMRRHLLTPA